MLALGRLDARLLGVARLEQVRAVDSLNPCAPPEPWTVQPLAAHRFRRRAAGHVLLDAFLPAGNTVVVAGGGRPALRWPVTKSDGGLLVEIGAVSTTTLEEAATAGAGAADPVRRLLLCRVAVGRAQPAPAETFAAADRGDPPPLSDGYHSLVDVGPGPVTGSWAASDADDTAETGPTRYWVPVRLMAQCTTRTVLIVSSNLTRRITEEQ